MGGYRKFFKDGTGGLRGGPGAATSQFESSEKREATSADVWDDSVPVGYWDMSDGSGTTLSDVSSAGNNLDGTLHASPGDAGPAWDTSNKVRGSNSLDFNGSGDSDRVIIDDNSALDFNVDDTFSISCWIKRSAVSGGAYAGLVCKMAQTSAADDAWEGYALYLKGSTQKQPKFLLYDGSGTDEELRVAGPATAINDTDWHHLVVTYNGNAALSGVKMYLDNSALSLSQVTDTLETDDDILTSTDMILGAFINNTSTNSTIYHFNGNMDEIAIWNKELSSDEVADLYNGGDGADLTDGIPKT